MTDERRKIVCHANGPRCHGCPHYWGETDRCRFAPDLADKQRKALEAFEEIADELSSQNWSRFRQSTAYQCIRQALTEPAVPDAVRALVDEWIDSATDDGIVAPTTGRDMLYACAKSLERALAQQGDDSGEGDG